MSGIMELGGDKPNRARAKIRNAEATITILKGGPCYYRMNATGDGIDALSIEAVPNAMQGFFAGLAMSDIAAGKIRETLVHGTCDYARVVTATRAATTDAWASYAAGAVGDVLSMQSGAGLQALSRAGSGSAGILANFLLVGTYASGTTQASSVGSATFSGSVWSVSAVKVFVRSL